MKDIRKALKMRYVANLSLRDISNATKLPHTTISDYCQVQPKNVPICSAKMHHLVTPIC